MSGEVSASPKETSMPAATEQLPPEGATLSSEPVVTISYHSIRLDCGRQCANITIKNEGYSSFSTNPVKFFVTMGEKQYSYSASFTPTFGNWKNTTIANHATYSGTLIFNTPYTTDPFTISYNDSTYNIAYVPN